MWSNVSVIVLGPSPLVTSKCYPHFRGNKHFVHLGSRRLEPWTPNLWGPWIDPQPHTGGSMLQSSYIPGEKTSHITKPLLQHIKSIISAYERCLLCDSITNHSTYVMSCSKVFIVNKYAVYITLPLPPV